MISTDIHMINALMVCKCSVLCFPTAISSISDVGLPTVGCNAVKPVAKVTVQVDCREENECMHAGITEWHQDLLNE